MFSVVYWVLMPAWPLGVTYTKGLLGIDQRTTLSESLAQAALERSAWSKRIEAESFKQIQADPRLMENVRQTGRTLFGDNCAPCHGSNAQGGKGFPNLTTASWLWGGDPETIAETIRVGINSAHPQSRTSQMMAFGRDGLLKKGEVDDVVAYVRSLSDPAAAKDVPAAKIEAGKAVFAANCVTCHGDNAKGKAELGAPDLTDNPGSTAATPSRSTTPCGAAGKATCQAGTAGCLRSTAKFSRSICSISGGGIDERDRRRDKADPDKGRCLVRDRRRAVAAADRQFAPRLCGLRVATGMRRACAPGRGLRQGRKVQRGAIVMHAAMREQGDR